MDSDDSEAPILRTSGQRAVTPTFTQPCNLRRSPRIIQQLSNARPQPTSKRNGACWNFFSLPENGSTTMRCFVCKKAFTYNSKSSSNLSKHCRKDHLVEYNAFAASTTEDVALPDLEPRQRGIEESIRSMQQKKVFSQLEAEKMLASFIIEDDQAFRVCFVVFLTI